MTARSHSVGCSLSPSRAICPQIQIGEPTLPEHGAIASQAADGDCERLLQTSKTGEGRAPVHSAELEPGDGGIAAVPADDLPGEGVGLGRPGDSQLITSRPNNAEGIPTRACGTALEGTGSARMPVTTGCWLTAHADASDPSDDPSPRELVRRLEQREGQAALLEVPLAESLRARFRVVTYAAPMRDSRRDRRREPYEDSAAASGRTLTA